MDSQKIYDQVGEHYSAASQGMLAERSKAIAKSFGYTEEELLGAAEGSNLGLSCGNPLALATLKKGETIIDLGSGAGFDVFLAADKVGSSGKVIGVDINKDMLARANKIKSEIGKSNIEFVESNITNITGLESEVADCIMSNCVINLVPPAEKHLIFQEMYRLLKPGGRLAVSDILAKRALPEKLKADMAMYVGCISGASLVNEYKEFLRDAGFKNILITDTKGDLNIYLQAAGGSSRKNDCCGLEVMLSRSALGLEAGDGKRIDSVENDLNTWVGSFRIYAIKN